MRQDSQMAQNGHFRRLLSGKLKNKKKYIKAFHNIFVRTNAIAGNTIS